MLISTKGSYALCFMLDIAEHYEGKPVGLKDVAARQEISEKYLEQIAATLRKNGLIGSSRGANGGYFLRKEAKEITVGEIIRVMEGDLMTAPCAEVNGIYCKNKDTCRNAVLWNKIGDAVSSVIDHITLEDMMGWKQEVVSEMKES